MTELVLVRRVQNQIKAVKNMIDPIESKFEGVQIWNLDEISW